MGIEINDGKLRVSASYSAKVPLDVDYASEDVHLSLSLEFDVGGDSTAIQAEAERLQATLAQQVKLAVFTQLGIDFTDEAGILKPKLAPKAVQAAPAPKPVPYSGGGSGGGGNPPYKPKADVTQEPVFVADFGEGAQPYYDLRGLKQRGVFKPRAADFRPLNKDASQVWLTAPDGSVKEDVVAALQAAGIE